MHCAKKATKINTQIEAEESLRAGFREFRYQYKLEDFGRNQVRKFSGKWRIFVLGKQNKIKLQIIAGLDGVLQEETGLFCFCWYSTNFIFLLVNGDETINASLAV